VIERPENMSEKALLLSCEECNWHTRLTINYPILENKEIYDFARQICDVHEENTGHKTNISAC
jgi:hypothetical protein